MIKLTSINTFYFILTFAIVIGASSRINWRRVRPLNLVPKSYMRKTIYNVDDDSPYLYGRRDNGRMIGYGYEQVHRRHGAMKRIYGGNVALHSTFPYQVGLLLKTRRGLNWCGGSIISHDYIITAAHCLDNAAKALVFLGSYEIKNPNESGSKRIEVMNSNFIIHPGWNPRRLIHDIAILRLPFPVEYSDVIQPIRLPNKSFVAESFAGKFAIASGWGRYSPAIPMISYSLRYVELPVLNQASCLSSYPFLLQPTNICTSGANGKSTCTGDSGGPLVIEGDNRNSHSKILIGLTSFGSIFGCEKGYPGVYTRITSYLDWISMVTGMNFENHKEKDDDNDNDNDDMMKSMEKNDEMMKSMEKMIKSNDDDNTSRSSSRISHNNDKFDDHIYFRRRKRKV